MEYDGMPPNGLAFSCRERAAQNGVKKPTILRAKRSTATPCWVAARLWRFSMRYLLYILLRELDANLPSLSFAG